MITVILMTICLSVLFVVAYAWMTDDRGAPVPVPVPVRPLAALPELTAWREFPEWMLDTIDMPALIAR